MAHAERILEDPQLIRMVFQRLHVAGLKVHLDIQKQSGECPVLGQEPEGVLLKLDPHGFKNGGVHTGEKVTVKLEDRGLKYETVTSCVSSRVQDNTTCTILAWPRTLRRTDAHRVAEFIPDRPARATFTNARNKLLEGHVKGFGDTGVELALDDPSANVKDLLRIGEESMLDVTLEQDLRLVASAKVAYYGEALVGLTFTDKTDQVLLGRYRDWLSGQKRIQEEHDKESGEVAQKREVRTGPITLPHPRMMVDRDPLILLITEKDEFARRMADAFGRKYGFLFLDYITGSMRYHLKDFGGDNPDWGRVRMIIVHNQLRLSSPLELARQMVEKEKCPLPILLVGTEEAADLKRIRALEAGAVDYQPIEPFKILSVLKKLDEVIAMFS